MTYLRLDGAPHNQDYDDTGAGSDGEILEEEGLDDESDETGLEEEDEEEEI